MKHIALGMLRVAVLALCACGSSESTNSVGPSAEAGAAAIISVSPSPVAVRAGDSKKLQAEVTKTDGSKSDISSDPSTVWTSDDPQTATVDPSGTVVGVKGGQTSIKASFGGASTSVVVTVVP